MLCLSVCIPAYYCPAGCTAGVVVVSLVRGVPAAAYIGSTLLSI